jgi:glycine cleavage system H protein
MEIDHCFFPDELLYDVEDNTWLRVLADDSIQLGVTSLLTGIAGPLVRVSLKTGPSHFRRGQSLGTLESEKFVGPVRSPISGQLVESNSRVVEDPRIINRSCYLDGWIAKIQPSNWEHEKSLLTISVASRDMLSQAIAKHHVRCFKAFPDREMYEIGTECNVVIVRLNDQLASMNTGEVVHLVSDDPTAYVEMVAWTDRTGHSLVDWRKEEDLFHFIVRKTR